jgi:hypothetical protein
MTTTYVLLDDDHKKRLARAFFLLRGDVLLELEFYERPTADEPRSRREYAIQILGKQTSAYLDAGWDSLAQITLLSKEAVDFIHRLAEQFPGPDLDEARGELTALKVRHHMALADMERRYDEARHQLIDTTVADILEKVDNHD